MKFDDDKFKGLYYDGLKQKVLENYGDAMNFFRQCLELNPADPAANFEVSEILESEKRPDSALAFIIHAVNGDPGNLWYKYFYAQNLQELGRYKDVITVYQDLVKAHPETTDLYYKLALAQLQVQEYKEAIETYTTLEQKLGAPDEDVSMSKIEIFEKIKEYDRAEEEIQKLITGDPGTPQYHDMLGNLYELEGKTDKAFEEYKKVEEIHPHDPMVHLSLADYYKTKNQDKEAFEELEKAFEEPSLDLDTKMRILLGLNTFTNTDSIFNEEQSLAKEMVVANPEEPKAHALYAEVLLHNRDIKGARDQYRMAVGEDSSKFAFWNKLLDLEDAVKDYKDMETESGKAIGLFPNSSQFYLDNGFASMQLKKFDDALNAFKSGIFYVLSSDSSTLGMFYTYLGDVNYYVRRFPASDSAYEAALKINPNNDNVLNDYSYYLSVRDTNLSRAEQMSKRANELVSNNDAYEDTYGWILYMLGRYEEAKEWENKALANGGEKDGTILEHYGDILFKLGDKDSAVGYWMKARERGSNSELLDRKIKDKQLYEK